MALTLVVNFQALVGLDFALEVARHLLGQECQPSMFDTRRKVLQLYCSKNVCKCRGMS